MTPLFAQVQVPAAPPDGRLGANQGLLIGARLLLLVAIFLMLIFFRYLRLWVQSFLSGARISIWELVGMELRKVDYLMIIRYKIALVQAGVKVTTQELEAHYLSGGRVEKTAVAVIAA